MNPTLWYLITNHFNENTVPTQLQKMQRQILQLENELEQKKKEMEDLSLLQERQKELPWYRWRGTVFKVNYRESYNHACDIDLGTEYFPDYELFVAKVFSTLFPPDGAELPERSFFYIEAPTGATERFEADGLRNLPLLEELILRNELRGHIRQADADIEKIDKRISQIDEQLLESNKYSAAYLETLKEERDKWGRQRQALFQLRNDDPAWQKISELNERLTHPAFQNV